MRRWEWEGVGYARSLSGKPLTPPWRASPSFSKTFCLPSYQIIIVLWFQQSRKFWLFLNTSSACSISMAMSTKTFARSFLLTNEWPLKTISAGNFTRRLLIYSGNNLLINILLHRSISMENCILAEVSGMGVCVTISYFIFFPQYLFLAMTPLFLWLIRAAATLWLCPLMTCNYIMTHNH